MLMSLENNEITVLIDSREVKKLPFPSWIALHPDRTMDVQMIHVLTKTKEMPAGDYAIEGHEDVCIIETKRSLREVHNNVCSNDWPREVKALKRLSEACKYPYVVWEMTPSVIFQKTQHVPNPQLVYDRWMQAIVRFNLRLMIAGVGIGPGPRRTLGEQLVRLMLAHIMEEERCQTTN